MADGGGGGGGGGMADAGGGGGSTSACSLFSLTLRLLLDMNPDILSLTDFLFRRISTMEAASLDWMQPIVDWISFSSR